MRGFIATMIVTLALLLAIKHYDPNAAERYIIDEPDQALVHPAHLCLPPAPPLLNRPPIDGNPQNYKIERSKDGGLA